MDGQQHGVVLNGVASELLASQESQGEQNTCIASRACAGRSRMVIQTTHFDSIADTRIILGSFKGLHGNHYFDETDIMT